MIRRLSRSPCLLALLLLAGCRADEGITEYQVPRENRARRLLVAILPDGNQTNWFFKLLGLPDAVAEHQKEFETFIQSIRLKDHVPNWQLPKGWTEEENPPGGKRYKTLRVTAPGEPLLEVTVSATGGDLLANINRWRKLDVDLPPFATEAEMHEAKPAVFKEVAGPDQVKLILVDMTGNKPRQGPRGMAMGPGGDPGVPPGSITFAVPADWRRVPPKEGFIKIDHAFSVNQESASADVTLTQLPTPDKNQWLGNLNRWRGQVGLPNLNELPKNEPTLQVAGKECPYLDFTGEGKDAKRMLMVVCENGPITWYIKMLAPAETVAKQKLTFETFAKSIRFDAAPGARP